MKINNKEIKKFFTVFSIVLVCFVLFFGIGKSVSNEGFGELNQSANMSNISSDFLGAINYSSKSESADTNEDSGFNKILEYSENTAMIDIDIDSNKLNVVGHLGNEFSVICDKRIKKDILTFDLSYDRISIRSTSKISEEITVKIPDYIFSKQNKDKRVTINVNSPSGYISVKRIISAGNDSLFVSTENGVISLLSLKFKSIEAAGKNSPIVVSDCSSDVMDIKNNSTVTVDGKYDELSIYCDGDILIDTEFSFKRIDAQSSKGDVTACLGESTGFTLLLNGCKYMPESDFPLTLSQNSTKHMIIFTYESGYSQINIEKTKGKINILK